MPNLAPQQRTRLGFVLGPREQDLLDGLWQKWRAAPPGSASARVLRFRLWRMVGLAKAGARAREMQADLGSRAGGDLCEDEAVLADPDGADADQTVPAVKLSAGGAASGDDESISAISWLLGRVRSLDASDEKMLLFAHHLRCCQ